MERPTFLFADTDVLIQLFVSSTQRILGLLRNDYGVSTVVVPEVEIEVINNKKFKASFQKVFRRACQAGWIQVLDAHNYVSLVGSNDAIQKKAAGISYSDIQNLGRQYNYAVDRGEAYTLATAALLSQPATSNDFSAIRVLNHHGYKLPVPILRAFDLIVFAYQVGVFDGKHCKGVRKRLIDANEHLPKSWVNASFEDGLESFVPRLVCAESRAVGALGKVTNQGHYTTPLVLKKL